MKKYLVTLQLHMTEVNLGLVEANSVEHAAQKVGVSLNVPTEDGCGSYTYNLGHVHPYGDPHGGGLVQFYEMEEITSAKQFDRLVDQQQQLEKAVDEAMSSRHNDRG